MRKANKGTAAKRLGTKFIKQKRIDSFWNSQKNRFWKKGENKSKRQLINEIGFPKMRPHEVMPFRPVVVRFASVSYDYHIKYEDHYYSVPYKYFGTQVVLKADSDSV